MQGTYTVIVKEDGKWSMEQRTTGDFLDLSLLLSQLSSQFQSQFEGLEK